MKHVTLVINEACSNRLGRGLESSKRKWRQILDSKYTLWLISIEPLAIKNPTNLQFRRNPEGNGWLAVCRRRMQQYSWSRSWIFLVHASPKNKSDRDKWVRFVRTHRANFIPLGRFMVYSEHFDKDCFERGHYVEGSRRTPRSGSVSTIWLQKTAQEPPSSRSERKRKRVSRHVLLVCKYTSPFI